jgi:hypothetical protein
MAATLQHPQKLPMSSIIKQKRSVPKRKTKVKVTIRAKTKRTPRKRSGFFAAIGNSIGRSVGGARGKALSQAGRFLGQITGMGDYVVSKNSLVNGGPPSFTRDAGLVVAHREFVSDVVSTTGFAVNSYSINPGLSDTFPWLSLLAQNFETYELLGLVFEFKTTSGNAISSTNNALGVVIMATEYDSIQPGFTSKQQMEAHEFVSSSVPSASFLHAVECNPKYTVLREQYLRSTAIPPNTDLRMYDLGNFQIATQGMQQAGVTIGELWVTYHVRLLKPQINPISDVASLYAHYNCDQVSNAFPFGMINTVKTNIPFPVVVGNYAPTGYNNISMANPDQITVLILYYCFNNTSTAVFSSAPAFALTNSVGFKETVAFNDYVDGEVESFNPASTGVAKLIGSFVVAPYNPVVGNNTLYITPPTWSTAPNTNPNADLIIIQIPSDLLLTKSVRNTILTDEYRIAALEEKLRGLVLFATDDEKTVERTIHPQSVPHSNTPRFLFH